MTDFGKAIEEAKAAVLPFESWERLAGETAAAFCAFRCATGGNFSMNPFKIFSRNKQRQLSENDTKYKNNFLFNSFGGEIWWFMHLYYRLLVYYYHLLSPGFLLIMVVDNQQNLLWIFPY
jgi:hypothetical protein